MEFSIRDLLLVTVIVAMAVGWWVEHQRTGSLMQERSEAVKDAKWLATNGKFTSLGRNGEQHAIARRLVLKYKVLRPGEPPIDFNAPNTSAPAQIRPSSEP